jgi:hypothetical protein
LYAKQNEIKRVVQQAQGVPPQVGPDHSPFLVYLARRERRERKKEVTPNLHDVSIVFTCCWVHIRFGG